MLATTIAGATQTAQQDDIDCGGHPYINANVRSAPNKLWRINFCLDAKNLPYTKFIQVNGAATWQVPFYETYGVTMKTRDFPEGIKNGSMAPVYWSSDGEYVYLNSYWCCLDGPGMGFVDVYGLYRLNLFTGKLETILPHGGAIKFSPNEKYLSYSDNIDEIHILNLEDGADQAFQLSQKYVNVGYFFWSPDSKKLIFVGALDHWEDNIFFDATPETKNGFSLLLLDLETMKVTTLLDNDIRMFTPGSYSTEKRNFWLDNDNIYLAGSEEGKTYLYDIAKRQLSLISTLTPTPTP